MKKNILGLFVGIVLLLPSFLFSAITKGPYLVQPTQKTMTIMWESDSNENCKVVYWQKGMEEATINATSFDSQNDYYLYRAVLEGLAPNQKYFYKVVMDTESSSESSFYSAPLKDNSFTFVAMGDSRSGHDTFAKLSSMIEEVNPKLIISMGDLVRTGRDFDQWGTHYFEPSKQLISNIPLVSTLGDHETNEGYDGYNFFYFFRNGIETQKQWFSYDYGNVHFVSLDFRSEFNQEMIDWFEKDMSQSDAKWKIVYLHRPTYNLGGHRTNWGNPIWQKLYSDNKVDIVFAGHSHIYERFYPMIPQESESNWAVTYITTGGAGAELYDDVENELVAVAKSVNHFIIASVTPDTLKLFTKLIDGSILDKFEIVKKHGEQTKQYLALVKPEKPVDIYMAFAHNLEIRVKQDLSEAKYFTKKISFESKGLRIDVPFKIRLSKESSKYYNMDELNGVLKKEEKYSGEIKIYTKNKFVKRKKFFEPSLFLELVYEFNGEEFIVPGAECRYYMPKK